MISCLEIEDIELDMKDIIIFLGVLYILKKLK